MKFDVRKKKPKLWNAAVLSLAVLALVSVLLYLDPEGNALAVSLILSVWFLSVIALMLVGGSPGSTAGGMKTTTLAIIVVASGCYIRQKKSYSVFGRSVSSQVVLEAFTLLMLYLTLFFTGSLIISCAEGLPILDCMFECASALGTVGLTTGITPTLGNLSKVILIMFMYFGRVGGLTLAYAALAGGKPDTGKFPEEKVMVG